MRLVDERDRNKLERKKRIEFELFDKLHSGFELGRGGIDVVVEDCAMRRKLDRLELVDKPLCELNPMIAQLVLEEAPSERPHQTEDEVKFVMLLRRVSRNVLGREHAFEQVRHHLQVADLGYGCDFLEADAERLQHERDVLVEEDGEVGALGLQFTRVDPRADVTAHVINTKQLNTARFNIIRESLQTKN